MTSSPRTRAARLIVSLVALGWCACPPPPSGSDAAVEFDAGNPPPRDACSGGCGANQRCDTVKRICVEACGGCDAGTCVKGPTGAFECRPTMVSCGGATCEAGQIACLGGSCACLAASNGADDSCRPLGQWCNGVACNAPRRYEECQPGSTTAKCPTGHICTPVFGTTALCIKDCGSGPAACDRGEICAAVSRNSGCLPAGLFRDQECNQNVPLPDGGVAQADGGGSLRITVPVSNTCLLKDNTGVVTDRPGTGSGNCTYALFKFWDDGLVPFSTCRPPGTAQEGQACKRDYTAGALATQCGTGLECALTAGGDDGVCLRMCNANPPTPGLSSLPACRAAEACVNLYRYSDPSNNAVLGVCMASCDVFDPTKNTCAAVGATATSCVPTTPAGDFIVSPDGKGVCVPRQLTVAAPGATCAQPDPFRGAACGDGQLCSTLDLDALATCTAVCDVDCNLPDGGAGPARCASEPSARCAAGKTCRRVTATTGAHVGFCQ